MIQNESPVEIATESCPIVQSLYVDDPILKHIFMAQFIGTIFALLLLLVLVLGICAWRAFSSNIRILIINLCVALTAANIGVLVSSVYHLHVFAVRPSGSQCYWLTFSYDDCFVIKNIFNVSLLSVYLSNASFSIERIITSLLDPPPIFRKWLAIFLVLSQWLCAIALAFLRSPMDTYKSYSHCSAHIPLPTQLRSLFFIIVGVQIFAISIYTALWYHNSTPMVMTALRRVNIRLYENVISTEISFPIVSIVILLFLLNVCLDWNFIVAIQSVVFSNLSIRPTNDLRVVSKWSEIQITTLPCCTLLIFVFLIRHLWCLDARKVYANVVNEYAQSLEEYYFNRSSATASLGRKSLEENNNCQKELTEENKKVLKANSTQATLLVIECGKYDENFWPKIDKNAIIYTFCNIEQTVAVICSKDAEESHI